MGGGRVEEGLLNGVQDQSSTHRHDLYDCTNGDNHLPQPGRSKSSSQKHFDALALTVMRMRQCGFENCFWNVPVQANVSPLTQTTHYISPPRTNRWSAWLHSVRGLPS